MPSDLEAPATPNRTLSGVSSVCLLEGACYKAKSAGHLPASDTGAEASGGGMNHGHCSLYRRRPGGGTACHDLETGAAPGKPPDQPGGQKPVIQALICSQDFA